MVHSDVVEKDLLSLPKPERKQEMYMLIELAPGRSPSFRHASRSIFTNINGT
jgi:hypothetical protein